MINLRKNFQQKWRGGFLMVEVVVVAAVIITVVVAVMTVAQKSIQVTNRALHTAEASFLLEEGAEVMRILRDNAWTNVSNLSTSTNYYPIYSGGAWSLSTTPTTVGGFTRRVNISDVNRDASTNDISVSGTLDTGTKLVVVTVSWAQEGQTVEKTVSFYLMDIFS